MLPTTLSARNLDWTNHRQWLIRDMGVRPMKKQSAAGEMKKMSMARAMKQAGHEGDEGWTVHSKEAHAVGRRTLWHPGSTRMNLSPLVAQVWVSWYVCGELSHFASWGWDSPIYKPKCQMHFNPRVNLFMRNEDESVIGVGASACLLNVRVDLSHIWV